MMIDRPPKNWKRPKLTLATRVQVLERTLCKLLDTKQIVYDHRPPIWDRLFATYANDTVPGVNNPDYIEAISEQEHKRRSFGSRATSYGSDAHARAKTKRLTAKQSAKVYKWPKRKIPTRKLRSTGAQR